MTFNKTVLLLSGTLELKTLCNRLLLTNNKRSSLDFQEVTDVLEDSSTFLKQLDKSFVGVDALSKLAMA